MSNIYIQEPPTNGKVLLVTSVGDIDIELWSKEAPKACRNFVQLCMEGYYDETIFHRVIPGFIVQGGDPTGTGEGGDSVYGKSFKDEFHSRLRFNRRGLLGMANAGKNDNASQFFFTLGEAGELNNKHTLFGKVTGNTVYNMVKLAEVEIEKERPVMPHKIIKTKILSNPFDDIVPRESAKKKEKSENKKKKSTAKATKDFKLLSFGEEAEEDEVETTEASKTIKSKAPGMSSHDLLEDEKLSTVPAVDPAMLSAKRKKKQHKSDDESSSSEEESLKHKVRKKLQKENQSSKDFIVDDDSGDDTPKERSAKISELKKEARRLKKEILATEKSQKNKDKEVDDSDPDDNDMVKAFKAERKKYREQTKKKGSDREADTMAMLSSFQSKLSSAAMMAKLGGDEEEKEDGSEEESDVDDSDLGWMNHKFSFAIHDKKVIDANVADLDRYEIYDPRNPLNKRRRDASKKAMKEAKR